MPDRPETSQTSAPAAVPPASTPRRGSPRGLARRLGAALVLVLAGAVVVPAATAEPAAAASPATSALASTPSGAHLAATALPARANGKDFDPGNIITDKVFFDGKALTSGQIQAFLRRKVPTCHAKPGDPDCLRNYRETTPTRKKDAFCKKYTGAKNERASKIIAKVAKACGVSAKVLLVLLQKEQSLVTATAPTRYQYERATGFACPDTAPCDPKKSGFFEQVYSAAHAFNRYAAPNAYAWRPLGKNKLPYHPDSSRGCGTATVNIKNQATRGLYIYTPYVPNKAALDNMYGTGDRCSSYGNRNFWRGFTDWFGSTRYAVRGAIQKAWLAAGDVDSSVGVQRGHETCHSKGHYCVQRFTRGTIAKSPKKGTFLMTGALEKAWRKAGAQKGPLKWPYSPAKARRADSSTMQRFSSGYLVDTPRWGIQQVVGDAAKVWRKNKHRTGRLGLPRAAAKCKGSGKKERCVQHFVGGYVTVHPSRGNRAVTGDIAKYWKSKKLDRGSLGYPSSNEKCSTKKKVTTCRQSFGSTRVVSSTKYPIRTVRAKIAKLWDSKRSAVGEPVKNRKCTTRGKGAKRYKVCEQQFTKGWISDSKKHGTFYVSGQFGKVFTKNKKKLGIPTSNRTCTKKSGTKTCTQTFTKGKIVKKGSKKPRVRT